MNFAEAARIVNEIPLPHTHPSRGRVLYRHIRKNRPKKVLELGTARGGSAVFIAAALQENGVGHLTSVDSLRWHRVDVPPEQALGKAGLTDWVTLNTSYSTYTWFLKAEIEKHLRPSGVVRPQYDLIFLDGAKNWSTDGLAVVLAERLLRPGGWLLLDDLGWSYAKNVKSSKHYGLELDKLSPEEKTEPHLRAIFDLLIETNPAFDRFVIQDDWWGWAHKSPDRSRHTAGGVLSGKPRPTGQVEPAPSPSRVRRVRAQVWQHVPPSAQRRIHSLRRKAMRRAAASAAK